MGRRRAVDGRTRTSARLDGCGRRRRNAPTTTPDRTIDDAIRDDRPDRRLERHARERQAGRRHRRSRSSAGARPSRARPRIVADGARRRRRRRSRRRAARRSRRPSPARRAGRRRGSRPARSSRAGRTRRGRPAASRPVRPARHAEAFGQPAREAAAVHRSEPSLSGVAQAISPAVARRRELEARHRR